VRQFIAILAVGSVACGLLAAGCGGGDASGDQPIDKATYIEQANAICKRASGKLAAELTSISSREEAKPNYDYTRTQIVIVNQALVPILENELKELRALGIPSEAKKDVEAFLAASQKGIDKTKANPAVVPAGHAPFLASEVPATKFGLKECPFAPLTGG
jgi:hypothetical protein